MLYFSRDIAPLPVIYRRPVKHFFCWMNILVHWVLELRPECVLKVRLVPFSCRRLHARTHSAPGWATQGVERLDGSRNP